MGAAADYLIAMFARAIVVTSAVALLLGGCFANPTPHPGGVDAINQGFDAAASDAVAAEPDTYDFADTGQDSGGAPDAASDSGHPAPDSIAGFDTVDAYDGSHGDDTADSGDAGQVDTDGGPVDVMGDIFGDSEIGADAAPDAPQDADPSDVGKPDVAADVDVADADVADAGVADADVTDAGPACGSTFEIPVILRCGNDYETVYYWSDWADDTCPTWYTPLGPDPVAYATLEALAAGEGCNADCLYDATNSVSFLTCGGPKSGYDVYQAAEDCPGPVYGTPDGIFDDLCDWEEYACYCDEVN